MEPSVRFASSVVSSASGFGVTSEIQSYCGGRRLNRIEKRSRQAVCGRHHRRNCRASAARHCSGPLDRREALGRGRPVSRADGVLAFYVCAYTRKRFAILNAMLKSGMSWRVVARQLA